MVSVSMIGGMQGACRSIVQSVSLPGFITSLCNWCYGDIGERRDAFDLRFFGRDRTEFFGGQFADSLQIELPCAQQRDLFGFVEAVG
jgi:hypothetical protein